MIIIPRPCPRPLPNPGMLLQQVKLPPGAGRDNFHYDSLSSSAQTCFLLTKVQVSINIESAVKNIE